METDLEKEREVVEELEEEAEEDAYVPPFAVLVTGAAGKLGTVLVAQLLARSEQWRTRLLLTDVCAPAADSSAAIAGLPFLAADLGDAAQTAALEAWAVARGCGAVVHLGAVSTEQCFERVLGANIVGVHGVYAAAARHGWRVVYASSNHAVGLHARSERLDAACALLPDGEYGLSKAYGELVARTCWLKRGVPSVVLRIGSCCAQPADRRMLSTWLSHADFVRLVVCALRQLAAGCARGRPAVPLGVRVVWGASANTASFYAHDDRAALGWAPRDSADAYTATFCSDAPRDPVAEHYQGGAFAAIDNTHGVPPSFCYPSQ